MAAAPLELPPWVFLARNPALLVYTLLRYIYFHRFITGLTEKRRQQADSNAKNAPVISSSQSNHQISPAAVDASRVRSSQSVPEMRLAAPPAQPFPNTPATAKILAKSADNVDNKLIGNYYPHIIWLFCYGNEQVALRRCYPM